MVTFNLLCVVIVALIASYPDIMRGGQSAFIELRRRPTTERGSANTFNGEVLQIDAHADGPRQRYIFWVRVRNVAVTGKCSDG